MGKFKGFVEPTDNWFKVPNRYIIMLHGMKASEAKVVLYILRHTWGFNEFDKPKRITLDEFSNGRKRKDRTRMDNGTGLSSTSVRKGLKAAEEHGYISITVDDFDKARIKKSYMFITKPDDKFNPYQGFLNSPEWKVKREEARINANGVCERCGDGQATSYHCHHLTYEHGWDCDVMYLQWLCRACHQFIHGKSENDPMLVSETDLSEVE